MGTGIASCFCKNLPAHNRSNICFGSHCTSGIVVPGWLKHDFTCARGYNTKTEYEQYFSNLGRSSSIDIASAGADLYVLEAIAYDVAHPRPFLVTDVDEFNFNKITAQKLLKLIGVSGPKTVGKFVEKHGEHADTAALLTAQYEKWKHILLPNVKIDSSLNHLKTEANDLLQVGTAVLASTLREYGHYSNVSELTYHAKFATAFDSDVGQQSAAIGWMKLVEQIGGGEAARISAELFRDKSPSGKKVWGASYGGYKWAIAADVLSYFEDGHMLTKSGKVGKSFNAKLFCDRMFSLQHNTGSILNKVSWGYKNGYEAGWTCNNMTGLLDAHHNSDWHTLTAACSDEVRDLFKEYWTVANREFIRANLEPVPFPNCKPAYVKKVSYGPKPDGTLVQEDPSYSAKAHVLIAVGKTKIEAMEIPLPVAMVGKKVVSKTW